MRYCHIVTSYFYLQVRSQDGWWQFAKYNMSVLNAITSNGVLQTESCLSKFKFSDLQMLNSPTLAYQLPMAVIALVDMNAFFAQCEQVRLGCTLDDPVVCCQWSSLIAVSYAARKFGIGRMDTLQSAKEKCPGLIVGHAAVFQKGETHWQYLDGPPNQARHKVSLDPYRRELRKVFKILSRECDLVEKASVDECYMDLGRLVFSRIIELFPFLLKLSDDAHLPPVPTELPNELQWEGKIFPTEVEEANQNDDTLQVNFTKTREKKSISIKAGQASDDRYVKIHDWDDLCSLVGSQVLYKIRQEVFKELNYTTSGGLATTKTVAKLAGGFVKPDYQTIIRPRAIHSFLHNFELSDITQMGGQLGERLLNKLLPPNTKYSITHIRNNWSLDDLREEFTDEPSLAERVYQLCRGTFYQQIKQRTVVKSMMSRKNFQEKEPVKTIKDCYDWIRVFVGDLYGRLIELDDENLNLSLLQKRGGDREKIYRPRTVSVQLTTTSWSKMSRQTQFPVVKDLDRFRVSLELTAFRLLCELMDNSKLTDEGVIFKNLRPNDEHLDQISTPMLANMGVVITNFVTTSDSSLIDSYSSSKRDDATEKEEMRRLFDEVNEVARDFKGDSCSHKVPRTNSFVRKMFQDFETERAHASANKKADQKPKAVFKEDRNYVEKLFEDFETSVMVEKASAETPKKRRNCALTRNTTKRGSANEGHQREKTSRSKTSTEDPHDIFLKNMMESRLCSKCNIAVEDVFEHRDYHIALELSSKLNGGTQTLLFGKKKPLSQSKLPFCDPSKH